VKNNRYCPVHWKRAFIHMDMDAFFASIEQNDFPELRGKPIAVTNGKVGTCIITCSYEARRFGVKTGMRLNEALQRCPHLIQRPARPERYAAVSTIIMQSLQEISPDIEIFSVDEAFLDVTHCQRLHGTAVRMAYLTRDKVKQVSGLSCGIGVSGDKTTSKFAAKLKKPGGITIIPPWETKKYLQDVPVTALCGIADGVGDFLAAHGVYRCGEITRLPVSVLARRFGNIGRRIWLMCQGLDPDKAHLTVAPPKTLGHGKVMPPHTHDVRIIKTFLLHMSEKLASRLRQHNLQAKKYFVGLRLGPGFWLGDKLRLSHASNDGKAIYKLCLHVLETKWNNDAIVQVQITALDPTPERQQLELFEQHDEVALQVNQVMDKVNNMYGEFALAPARLVNRSTMPNVIAPAWKPTGHRQSIPTTKKK